MTKSEIITLCYKVFIKIMIISQIYLLIFEVMTLYAHLVSALLAGYFMFRYYILNKLDEQAAALNITLNELLKNHYVVKDTPCDD